MNFSRLLKKKKLFQAKGAPAQTSGNEQVNNVTAATPAATQKYVNMQKTDVPVAEDTGDLEVYINSMLNRRRKKGALLPQLSETLGQSGALGV